MKKSCLLLSLSLLALTGCARHYVMKLSNGARVITASKPRLKDGFYYYKDGAGRRSYESQSRVLEIEPVTMARREKSPFTPPSK